MGTGIPDIIPGAEDMGICMGMAAFISGSWSQTGDITNGADSIAIPSMKLNSLKSKEISNITDDSVQYWK